MSVDSLITGGTGFVGPLLAKALAAAGDRVAVSGLFAAEAAPDGAAWRRADFRSDADVTALIAETRPRRVFHLAGVSYVPDAEKTPAVAYDVNVTGTVRLLRAVRDAGINSTVLVIGSGTQYGTHPPEAQPLTEQAEQRPANVYAATKCAQEVAALQLARAHGMRVICTRSFSHSGIGHPPHFLLPALVARARGGDCNLAIGNDVIRDYLHVDDVVRAYIALSEGGIPGEAYNVASGTGVSVRELATSVLELAGIAGTVRAAPELMRASDMPVLIGSPRKLSDATGWAPRKTWRDILVDLLKATPSAPVTRS
jgi:GDP-4-dehydro-6-deoxy-D-mannose reductase